MDARSLLHTVAALALLATLLVSHPPPAIAQAAPAYTITDLGTLGGASSHAIGVNGAGQVTGYSSLPGSSAPLAFLWRAGTMTDLGTLGGDHSLPQAINGAGQVAGFSLIARDSPVFRAFLWREDTGMTDLGALGEGYSYAYAVNDAGQAAGASAVGRVRHAVLWQDGVLTDLGTLGGEGSVAYAIDAAGRVVGEADIATPDASLATRAFLWQDGAMTDLGTLDDWDSTARAINAAGQVVGYAYRDTIARRAFLWQEGEMRPLGDLGGGNSEAAAINNAGQVVGMSTAVDRTRHAFLWQDGMMTDLNALMPADAGWELTAATGINDAGQIVGAGRMGGQTRAFLLTPARAPIGAGTGPTCFPEQTGFCIGEPFRGHWRLHGSLARNGYPISDQFVETLEDGRKYEVQYFERARLEYHPEHSGSPNEVLLGQFGRRVLRERTGQEVEPPAEPREGALYFAATGHNLGGRFAAYWGTNGGLRQFGLPLTEEFEETLEDGNVYTVQYFERGRFEHHPENAPPYDVLLGQFGRQILAEAER
jgi:probable HAF family extracellular repeat protein